jgi:hypothetical protein
MHNILLSKNICDRCGSPLGDARLIAGNDRTGNHFCSIACYDRWAVANHSYERNQGQASAGCYR